MNAEEIFEEFCSNPESKHGVAVLELNGNQIMMVNTSNHLDALYAACLLCSATRGAIAFPFMRHGEHTIFLVPSKSDGSPVWMTTEDLAKENGLDDENTRAD